MTAIAWLAVTNPMCLAHDPPNVAGESSVGARQDNHC
jgi:hypothetical protein